MTRGENKKGLAKVHITCIEEGRRDEENGVEDGKKEMAEESRINIERKERVKDREIPIVKNRERKMQQKSDGGLEGKDIGKGRESTIKRWRDEIKGEKNKSNK